MRRKCGSGLPLAPHYVALGARPAFGINRALTREDFERESKDRHRIDHPPLTDATMERRRGHVPLAHRSKHDGRKVGRLKGKRR
jgi:hypothetical protein